MLLSHKVELSAGPDSSCVYVQATVELWCRTVRPFPALYRQPEALAYERFCRPGARPHLEFSDSLPNIIRSIPATLRDLLIELLDHFAVEI
jgi:hypothetical protein